MDTLCQPGSSTSHWIRSREVVLQYKSISSCSSSSILRTIMSSIKVKSNDVVLYNVLTGLSRVIFEPTYVCVICYQTTFTNILINQSDGKDSLITCHSAGNTSTFIQISQEKRFTSAGLKLNCHLLIDHVNRYIYRDLQKSKWRWSSSSHKTN